MRSNKLSWLGPAGLAVLLAAGGYTVSEAVTARRIVEAQVAVRPYTVTLNVYATRPKGQLISTETRALRADGSTALVQRIYAASSPLRAADARKIRLADGEALTLADAVRAKVEWPRSSARALAAGKAWLMHPPANCTPQGDKFLGYSTIAGQRVAEVRSKVLPNGDRFISWRAVSLSCAELRYEAMREGPNGHLTAATETKLVSLTLGDPNPALFDTGAGYRSVMPSELLRLRAAHQGVAWSAPLTAEGQSLDAAFARRAAARRANP